MSSSTDGKWRNPNSSQQRRDRSSISGPPSSSIPRQRNNPDATAKGTTPSTASPAPIQQPNAWSNAASVDKGRTTSAARTAGTAAGAASQTSSSGSAAAQGDPYVPAGGFNREEVKEFLSKRHQEAVSGDSEQVSRWKASSEAGSTTKQGGPWGQKPTMMSNGSDFWVHLKKQLAAKEQGG